MLGIPSEHCLCRTTPRWPAASVPPLSKLLSSLLRSSFEFRTGFLNRLVAGQCAYASAARLYEPQALMGRPVLREVDQRLERTTDLQPAAIGEIKSDGFAPFIVRSGHHYFPPFLFLLLRQIREEPPVPRPGKILSKQQFRGAL